MTARLVIGFLVLLVCLVPESKCARGQQRSVREDVEKILALALKAEDKEARRLVHKAWRLVQSGAKFSSQDSEALAKQFADGVARVVRTTDDASEVFGAAAPKRVVRQVLYRRYLELWIYQEPLPLVLVWNCEKGLDARIQSVHPLPRNLP